MSQIFSSRLRLSLCAILLLGVVGCSSQDNSQETITVDETATIMNGSEFDPSQTPPQGELAGEGMGNGQMAGMRGQMAEGELPEGMERPEGMEMGEGMTRPEGMELPEGMEMGEGMTRPEGMELPEGMERPEGMEMGEGMTRPEGMAIPEGMTPPEGMTSPMGTDIAPEVESTTPSTSVDTSQLSDEEIATLIDTNYDALMELLLETYDSKILKALSDSQLNTLMKDVLPTFLNS